MAEFYEEKICEKVEIMMSLSRKRNLCLNWEKKNLENFLCSSRLTPNLQV